MARKRRYHGPPPPPPATTFIVCHPMDEWRVRWDLRTNEDVILTERCPSQHIIYLPLRLKLLAQSGAWFDSSLDASWTRGAIMLQNERAAFMAGTEKPRCQAWTKDYTQCTRAAVLDSTQGDFFCKAHKLKRNFTIHKPGDGLDQQSTNPLSEDSLDEISSVAHYIGTVLYDLREIQQTIQFTDEEGQRLGEIYATLHDQKTRLNAIVTGDRERDAKLRRELSSRINRMVDRICIARKIEGVEVHMTYIRSGGKSQKEMTIEELKAKVDWLLNNYQDVFPADTREWQPPDVVITGMEPGGIRRKDESDPVIEPID